MTEIVVNEANQWRLQTPGATGWAQSPRAGTPNKYMMISADTHANEPGNLWAERIDAKYKDRLPKMWIDEKGIQWRKMEASEQPDRWCWRAWRRGPGAFQGRRHRHREGPVGRAAPVRPARWTAWTARSSSPARAWACGTRSTRQFAHAQCEVYNTWAWENFGPYVDRLSPAAALATGDIPATLAEIDRCLKLGFRHFTLPCKPLFGPPKTNELNYNKVEFDPMWAASSRPKCPAPSTSPPARTRAPRAAGRRGRQLRRALALAHAGAAGEHLRFGVAERHPNLKFGSVEAGIGWVPWMLDAMDEAYLKHHFWVKPKLKALPPTSSRPRASPPSVKTVPAWR
jgi:predicted TIM-barrel fold metal-dependent hydrolase